MVTVTEFKLRIALFFSLLSSMLLRSINWKWQCCVFIQYTKGIREARHDSKEWNVIWVEIRGCCWPSTQNKCNGKRSNYLYISYILYTYPQNYECEFICRSRKINYLFWNWSWKPYLLNINKISRVPIRQCSTVEIVKLIPNFCAVCPF